MVSPKARLALGEGTENPCTYVYTYAAYTSGEYVYRARLSIRVTYQICISRVSLLMRGSLIFTSAAYAMQELLVIINTNYQISSHVSKWILSTVYYEIRH